MKPYYKQLLEGCGNPKCRHPLCAGISGDVSNLEKNGLTRESAKSLADRLEKMTRGYFCQNFCENLLKLKSEDSQESLVMLNPAAHDTSPYPVMLISSNKEGKLVHKLKEIGTDSSPIRNDSEADTRVKSTLLSNRNTGNYYILCTCFFIYSFVSLLTKSLLSLFLHIAFTHKLP